MKLGLCASLLALSNIDVWVSCIEEVPQQGPLQLNDNKTQSAIPISNRLRLTMLYITIDKLGGWLWELKFPFFSLDTSKKCHGVVPNQAQVLPKPVGCLIPPLILETLPEAQWTQDIEYKTWIISKRWNRCKFQFSTLSLPPLPGNHLSHLVHLPVILLAHHHLNDNRYLPMFQQHILLPTWSPSPHWARPPSKGSSPLKKR